MADAVQGVPTQLYQRNIGLTAKHSGVHNMWQVIRDLHLGGFTDNEINYWLWSLDVIEKGPTTIQW